MFKRNQAFSMNLADSLGEDGGAIRELIVVKGKLYVLTENRIVQILTADSIDPDNKNLETLHHHQLRYKVGTSDPAVSRTIIQSKSILDSVMLDDRINKEELIDHVWDCTTLLINCSQALRKVYSEVMELMPLCDELITKAKAKGTIPSLPQVEALEEQIVTYLGSAKRFLEKTHAMLCVFYGSPDSEANFQAYRDWIKKNEPEGSNMFKYLDSYKESIKEIAWSRNALEINHSKEGFRVDLYNFRIQPGNRFSAPSLSYDFTEKGGGKLDDSVDLIEFFTFHTNQMLSLFEVVFLEGVSSCWNKNFNFGIYRIPDSQISKECPILYRVSFNPNLKKKDTEQDV